MKPGRLQGKVALVVGGGSGMGRAGAVAMAAEGAKVAVSDIALERAEAVAASITAGGGTAAAMHVDVTLARAGSACRRRDRLSLRPPRRPLPLRRRRPFRQHQDKRLTELDDDVWHRMIDVHLTGTFWSSSTRADR